MSYKKRFKYLLKYLIETHGLVPKTCDQVVTDFNNFLNNEVKKQKIGFFLFEVENKLLDHFSSNHEVQTSVIHSKIDSDNEPRLSSRRAWFQYQ